MYIVTGVSRGLGKAIVEGLLKENQVVLGIGRSNPFGDSIEFIQVDLNDSKAVAAIELNALKGDITLINNAGILGEIGRISEQETSDLEEVMQVNVFAPMALTRMIYAQMNESQEFRLVNISSGAAKRSIPSWSAYCASKSALNRLTENFFIEEQELGRKVKAYAVSPGVIDTGMQAEIRAVDDASFSQKANFVSLKEDGKLFSSEEAANRLFQLMQLPYDATIFYDLRAL